MPPEGVQVVNARREQRVLQPREPIEWPKWVTVAGKTELARDAEHEAELRNRADVIEPASCEPRLPGAEGDQIPAPIEPQDVAKALGIAWQGDKTLEKIKPERRGVGKLPTPSSEKGVGGSDRTLAREGESPADSAQLVRTTLVRIGAPAIAAEAKPQVLIPFDLDEAVTVAQAAQIAGRTAVTVRTWAAVHDLGRPIGRRWMVSRVALAMHLDGDREALKAYLAGDRESALVTNYFQRFGLQPQKVWKENVN